MKKIILFYVFLSIIIPTCAQENPNEYYSYSQNVQIDTCSTLKIKREIKGGTKFIVNFEGNWDEDMKGAFRYACKIWEENLPTMLPITIKASIGQFGRSYKNALSKVTCTMLDNDDESGTAPEAKYVILREYLRGGRQSFLTLHDSLEMSRNPDIEITYNEDKMNLQTFSFSEDTVRTTKIDFITQALRDIAAGIGFCNIQIWPTGNALNIPYDINYHGLERVIIRSLSRDNPYIAYNQATQGSLPVEIFNYGTLNLYAPSTWQSGVSLNTFYPQSNSGISQLLTYNYGKGTIIRNITDNYEAIFDHGFSWLVDLGVGSGNSYNYITCKNDEAIDYHGSFTIQPSSRQRNIKNDKSIIKDTKPIMNKKLNSRYSDGLFDFRNYCKPYDPTLTMDGNVDKEGWTFALLKEDGTWDVIEEFLDAYAPFEIELSNITLHYPDSVYARTTDNYLRGRVSQNIRRSNYEDTYNDNKTMYFVLDYLPQKVKQNLAKIYDESYLNDEYLRDIEIAMSNIEGATRIYVEQLEEGDYYPYTMLLSNPKQGRFLTTVDKEYDSEFTIISYNKNGSKRSDVLTVEALEPASLSLKVENEHILVTYGHKNKRVEDCTYSIQTINSLTNSAKKIKTGVCRNRVIPTSLLKEGMNIINVVHPSGKKASIKILKNSSNNNKSNISVVL